jgi:serine protease 16
MLAGWFRLRFPHLVHASVASSAPVEAVLDMTGYNDYMANAYSVADNGVGGSSACEAAIRTGHASIGTMFNTADGRSTLAKIFGREANWYADRDNQANFAGNGVAYFPAQENDPSCSEPACDVGSICQIMTNVSLGDEVARLAQVRMAGSSGVKDEEHISRSRGHK